MTWVQYSTGDSFGHDAGAYHEIIGWYQTPELAEQAKNAVESSQGEDVMVPVFDGSSMRKQTCFSWHGYFGSLDHVSVDKVIVSK